MRNERLGVPGLRCALCARRVSTVVLLLLLACSRFRRRQIGPIARYSIGASWRCFTWAWYDNRQTISGHTKRVLSCFEATPFPHAATGREAGEGRVSRSPPHAQSQSPVAARTRGAVRFCLDPL